MQVSLWDGVKGEDSQERDELRDRDICCVSILRSTLRWMEIPTVFETLLTLHPHRDVVIVVVVSLG